MTGFTDRVAVITGAASGIGLALARRAVKEGMKLVLADIEGEKLKAVAGALGLPDDRLSFHAVDVSREEDIARMADEAFDRFGNVHLLCNNAGVLMTRETWKYSAADWEWILGVNLWSVIHGVRIFVPRMLKQECDSHIINTASIAGLTSPPGLAAYNVSKHGVVTLSEALYFELAAAQARIGVSLLCPAWVSTGIDHADRNRQERFGAKAPPSDASSPYEGQMTRGLRSARLTSDDIADAAFEAVAENRFYVLPHVNAKRAIAQRMEDVLASRNPTPASLPSTKDGPSCAGREDA